VKKLDEDEAEEERSSPTRRMGSKGLGWLAGARRNVAADGEAPAVVLSKLMDETEARRGGNGEGEMLRCGSAHVKPRRGG